MNFARYKRIILWFLPLALMLNFSCRSNKTSSQDEMFGGRHEKSMWAKKRLFKKKREAFNPYVDGKKDKPSTVQARQDKKTAKRAKREVRKQKRWLRRHKGAYQKP